MSSSVDPLLARQPEQPPPPPGYDWRWAARILGQFFVSLGVLLVLLIAFLEWGTNLQQHRAQSDLRRKFAAASASATTLAPVTSTTAAAPSTAPSTSTTAATGSSTSAATVTAPPTTAAAAPTTVLAPEQRVSVREGQPLATIEIPRIGVKQVVVSGVDGNDLRVGPGHFRTTPQPGQAGNVAIAGHRTTYGAPFADLDQVKQGDQIVITTLANRRYVYVVTQSFEVSPNDVSVLDQGPDSVLTLVTCTPKFTASRRLIVRGQLDSSASAPVAPAPPTTTPASGPSSTTAGGSATTVASGGAAVTPTTLPPEGDQGGGNEGLVAGWGHDGAAWLQVLLWGLVCSFVGAGATLVSRKRHDNWTGAMVGLLPFVVALWFFYENVARLLPPNL